MIKFGSSLSAPFVEQEQRRTSSLSTPVAFDVVLGASPTTLYTGKEAQSFLIRALAIVNDTAGAISVTIRVDGNQWITQSIAANSLVRLSDIEGILIDAETDMTGTGLNLRAVGWGVRVQGGDNWAL